MGDRSRRARERAERASKRWKQASKALPPHQSMRCILRLKGGRQPDEHYTHNGSAWWRADGDYDSADPRAPGRVDNGAVVSWKSVDRRFRSKVRRYGDLWERGLRGNSAPVEAVVVVYEADEDPGGA